MTKYKAYNQDEYLLQSNLLGARSMQELEQLERVAFYIASSKSELEGFHFLLPLNADSIKKLHEVLFKNIYSFAGEFRNVSLMKDTTRFCELQFIEVQLANIEKELAEEENWKSIEEAAERLAYYKTELNMIHPFREGNGRTIRLIIREIAKIKRYTWNFEDLDKLEYLNAMIKSQADSSLLEKLLLKSLE